MYLRNQLTLEELYVWFVLWYFDGNGEFTICVGKVKLIEWGGCNVELNWGFVTVLLKIIDQEIHENNHCDGMKSLKHFMKALRVLLLKLAV